MRKANQIVHEPPRHQRVHRPPRASGGRQGGVEISSCRRFEASRSHVGDGSQTRSFCDVDDLVEGTIQLMDTGSDVTGPVTIGNPHEFTISTWPTDHAAGRIEV